MTDSEYTPTTEEIREYVETGGEPRPWVELDEAEEAREKARGEAFDRWLAAHDAEMLATERERIIQDMQERSHPDDWGVPCVYIESYAERLRGEQR